MTIKQMARLGGKARAGALSKERLSEIAREAGKASGERRRLASELAGKLKSCQGSGSVENKKR